MAEANAQNLQIHDLTTNEGILTTEWIALHFGENLSGMEKKRLSGFRYGFRAGYAFGGGWGIDMRRRQTNGDDLSGDAIAYLQRYENLQPFGYGVKEIIERVRDGTKVLPLAERISTDENVSDSTHESEPNSKSTTDDDLEHEEMPASFFTRFWRADYRIKDQDVRSAYWAGRQTGQDVGVYRGIRIERRRAAGLNLEREDAEFLEIFENQCELEESYVEDVLLKHQ